MSWLAEKTTTNKAISTVLIVATIFSFSYFYFSSTEETEAAWYDSNFTYCRKLTINDGGTVGGVATTTTLGFPILATTTLNDLKATSSAGKIEKLDSNNNKPFDLVFTSGTDCNSDGGSLLDFEIEAYSSTTGALTAWFQSTDISSTTEKYVLMYYGNSSATDVSDASGVWDAQGEQAVWHLAETDLDGGSGDIKDSTSNSRNGTTYAGPSVPSSSAFLSITGRVDGALEAQLSNSNIQTGNWDISGSQVTMSTWFNAGNDFILDNCGPRFMAKTTSSSDYYWLIGACGGFLRMRVTTTGGLTTLLDDTSVLTDETWYHVTAVYDGANMIIYLNGAEIKRTSKTGTISTSASTPVALFGEPAVDDNYFIDGRLDEARVYNRRLDPMDILTHFNMQVANAVFLSFGSEETEMGGGGNPNGVGNQATIDDATVIISEGTQLIIP